MPISLDTPLAPSVKLLEVGQYVNGHVCHVSVEPLFVFNTRRVALTEEGKERSQEKVTLLITGGTGQIKDGEGYRAAQLGEEVVIWLNGGRRWAWIEAKRKAGGLDVGDVVKFKYSGDEPGRGAQPKKVWSIGIRKPNRQNEKELAAVGAAETIYHRIASKPTPSLSRAHEDYEPDEQETEIPF